MYVQVVDGIVKVVVIVSAGSPVGVGYRVEVPWLGDEVLFDEPVGDCRPVYRDGVVNVGVYEGAFASSLYMKPSKNVLFQ